MDFHQYQNMCVKYIVDQVSNNNNILCCYRSHRHTSYLYLYNTCKKNSIVNNRQLDFLWEFAEGSAHTTFYSKCLHA